MCLPSDVRGDAGKEVFDKAKAEEAGMRAAGWMLWICIGLPILAAYVSVWINERRK